ncbi:MAG: hypothetical protein HKN42_00005 [Granulosicoccus sp.]|nr:hypothetical protein [Granulosicoccus sp.]
MQKEKKWSLSIPLLPRYLPGLFARTVTEQTGNGQTDIGQADKESLVND